MLLLIDNYDSFTHNLARYFCELGQRVKVVRNDEISIAEIRRLAPDYLVISPGPCTPDQSGISLNAIEIFAGQLPILGVCLGHQAIGQVLGAKVVQATSIMHGKTSEIAHEQHPMFAQVPNPFIATRYHSLVLEPETLPKELQKTAWVNSNQAQPEIMAIAHRTLPLFGVQFHPESLLTSSGHQILRNFLTLSLSFNSDTHATV